MTGREVIAQMRINLGGGDPIEMYLENKFSLAYDMAKSTLLDLESNNGKYTDAGHSNCVAVLKQFVNEIEAEIKAEYEKPVSKLNGKTPKAKPSRYDSSDS